jgi:hypothetical protein
MLTSPFRKYATRARLIQNLVLPIVLLSLPTLVHSQRVAQCKCPGRGYVNVTLAPGQTCQSWCGYGPSTSPASSAPSSPSTTSNQPSAADIEKQRNEKLERERQEALRRERELRARHLAEQEQEERQRKVRVEAQAARDQEEFARRKQQAIQGLRLPSDGGGNIRDLKPVPSGQVKSIAGGQSIPAKVLAKRQADVKELDEKIKQAQEALRRLMESHEKTAEMRAEWIESSLEATHDAEKLSLSLVIDLVGAHVEHLADVNNKERAEVLERLLNRSGADSKGKSLHNLYGMLVNRKDELERIGKEAALAGKENELREKINDLKKGDNSKFTREDFYDCVSQLKKVEELAGPSKDLLDAGYIIYKQAASFRRLSQLQGNDQQTLAAANSLRQYIQKLEAQKQSAKASVDVRSSPAAVSQTK